MMEEKEARQMRGVSDKLYRWIVAFVLFTAILGDDNTAFRALATFALVWLLSRILFDDDDKEIGLDETGGEADKKK